MGRAEDWAQWQVRVSGRHWHLRGYVVEQTRNGRLWWWFFTKPSKFSVWWQPDGSKTMHQYALEEAAKARNYLLGSGNQ
jgi:hypothetical protein